MIGTGGLALLTGASVCTGAWIVFAFVGRDPMAQVPPGAELLVMIAGPLLFLGMVTLGVVTMRAGVFTAWAGAALVVAAPAGAVAPYAHCPNGARPR